MTEPAEGSGTVTCDECPRTFDTEQGLRIHKARVHKRQHTDQLSMDDVLFALFPGGLPPEVQIIEAVSELITAYGKILELTRPAR